jgi:hypothetical protein
LKDEFLSKQKLEVTELKTKLYSLTKKLDTLREEKKRRDEAAAKVAKFTTPNGKNQLEDITRGCIIRVEVKAKEEKSFEVFKVSRQQFKEKYLKEFLDKVAYVDLDKHTNRIFIRCNSAEAAQSMLANKDAFLSEYEYKELLGSAEEGDYFEKIASQRTKKQDKKERKQKATPVEAAKPSQEPVKIQAVAKSFYRPTSSVADVKKPFSSNQQKAAPPTKHFKFDEDDE